MLYTARLRLQFLGEDDVEIASIVHFFTHHPENDRPEIWVIRAPQLNTGAKRLHGVVDLFGPVGEPLQCQFACEVPPDRNLGSNLRVPNSLEPLLIITADTSGVSFTAA
jgi:hypothetical protein